MRAESMRAKFNSIDW